MVVLPEPFGFGLFFEEAHGPDRIRQRGWIFCCFMAWVPFLEDRVRIGKTNRFRKAADPKDAGHTFLSARCRVLQDFPGGQRFAKRARS